MNIEFEEFSTEKEMLEFVKSVIPEDYDEVYIANDKDCDDIHYVFYDTCDLAEWMKEFIASNAPDREIEHEISDWHFSVIESSVCGEILVRRKLGMDVEYSYDLHVYQNVCQEKSEEIAR